MKRLAILATVAALTAAPAAAFDFFSFPTTWDTTLDLTELGQPSFDPGQTAQKPKAGKSKHERDRDRRDRAKRGRR